MLFMNFMQQCCKYSLIFYFCNTVAKVKMGMNNIRITKSVQTILNAFSVTQRPYSVASLSEMFKNQMNKTTVYRILNKLENANYLHSFIGKDGLRWYAHNDNCNTLQPGKKHSHFQCKLCGELNCIDIEIPLPDIQNKKIDSVQTLLIGECGSC